MDTSNTNQPPGSPLTKGMKANITVCIVEDNSALRTTFASYVQESPGFQCIGAFETAEQALKGIPPLKPNVVLMDINLPGMSGIECVDLLKKGDPSLQIIMLTVYEDSEQVFQALAAGACGYLVKNTPPEKVLEAIQEVQSGGSPMSSHIARKVVQTFRQAGQLRKETEALAPREQQVVELLAKGLPYKQIALEMNISSGTVCTYIRRIYEKLHVNNRTEAVMKYLGGR
ncbi:MAG: DNA-binding response regulator [Verrucomicrobiales bacterium]|nr:DNA-binding response regulator [Verrucomicrobiales bacterium]